MVPANLDMLQNKTGEMGDDLSNSHLSHDCKIEAFLEGPDKNVSIWQQKFPFDLEIAFGMELPWNFYVHISWPNRLRNLLKEFSSGCLSYVWTRVGLPRYLDNIVDTCLFSFDQSELGTHFCKWPLVDFFRASWLSWYYSKSLNRYQDVLDICPSLWEPW